MSNIVKNLTQNDHFLNDLGTNLPANSNVDLSNNPNIKTSNDLIICLSTNGFVYNNGNEDLSLSDAIDHIKNIKRIESNIKKVSYSDFKNFIINNKIKYYVKYVEFSGIIFITVNFSSLNLVTEIINNGNDYEDFLINIKPYANYQSSGLPSFSDKITGDHRLFNRTTGVIYNLNQGYNALSFEIEYEDIKFNEIEIIGGELGDSVNLKILDSQDGLISGTPYYPLNQFGFNVYVAKEFYKRKNNYDANLIQTMIILIEYNSVSAKNVFINYILHELKD